MKHLLAILLLLLAAALPLSARPESRDSLARQSFALLEARANSGDNHARYRLARTLETGYGDIVPRDSIRARRLYELSAHGGDADAQNYLGFLLFREEKPDSAIHWLIRAADQGNSTAYTNIGWVLLHGQGALQDYDKALYWLGEGVKRDSPAAAAMLADMYRLGIGLTPDTLQAKSLYDKALTLYAGGNYRDRQAIGDVSSALVSLYPDTASMPTDSLMLLARQYTQLQAPIVAMHFVSTAAARHLPLARTLMGQALARGYGVDYDPLASTIYFIRAAMDGDASAQFITAELAELYPDILTELNEHYSLGLSSSQTSAQYWLEQACKAGVKSIEQAEEPLKPYGL